MKKSETERARILIVDDESHIIETYRKCLEQEDSSDTLDELHKSIFGSDRRAKTGTNFELVFAQQGQEAVKKIQEARDEGRPFALVFLDMRMPPGIDGYLTAKQIRRLDQHCNIVIVTAYSDVEVSEMASEILPRDKFFFLRKPFTSQEIQQFAAGLTSKWSSETLLEALLEERTQKVIQANIALHQEMDIRQEAELKLQESAQEIDNKEEEILGVTNAIDILFRKKFNAQQEFEKNMVYNVKQHVLPYLKKVKGCETDEKRDRYCNLIEKNLENIISPFMLNLSQEHVRLSPEELNIAHLISQGVKSKEIGELMGISVRTVEYYRNKLREKMGLKQSKKSLKAALHEFNFTKK